MTDFNKLSDVLTREEKISFALRALYSGYGYKRYKMSKFEEYDLYAGKKDFLVSENIITFTNTDGKLLALKPDVTLSILKSVEKSTDEINKLQYSESVYRAKSGDGFKELMQTGIECIGNIGVKEISEVILLAYESLKEISDSFALEISSLDLVDAVIDGVGASEATKKEIIANLGRKNLSGIKKACEAAALSAEDTAAICALGETYGAPEMVIETLGKMLLSDKAREILGDLKALLEKLCELGVYENVCLDFSLIANRKFYNGITFGGYVEGSPECVLKGGQYDRLAGKMNVNAKAIGFAVYLDELGRIKA